MIVMEYANDGSLRQTLNKNFNSVTLQEVLTNWKDVTEDKDVKRDVDALAIAYAAEGMLLLQNGQKAIADSTLAYAIPIFRLKHSKAYFLVAFADLDRELHRYKRALTSYKEIMSTMDSMPELWDIDFYRESGYAPFAYGANPDFNFRSFRTTNVLRWEYKPGSALFVVWQQGREDTLDTGQFKFGRDFAGIFGAPSRNVFLVKMSYWLNY